MPQSFSYDNKKNRLWLFCHISAFSSFFHEGEVTSFLSKQLFSRWFSEKALWSSSTWGKCVSNFFFWWEIYEVAEIKFAGIETLSVSPFGTSICHYFSLNVHTILCHFKYLVCLTLSTIFLSGTANLSSHREIWGH